MRFPKTAARPGRRATQGSLGTSVWSVAFDPAKPGRMYASVHEEALYVSQDYGRTWTKDGLEGSRVYRMQFVPEAGQ